MTYEIHIDHLRLHAFHGVLPQERTVGADFFVTLRLLVDADESTFTQDDLCGTISYADIAAAVRNEMQTPSLLLEHAAHRITSRLLTDFPRLLTVEILLEKQNPPIGLQAEGIGVKLSLTRQ